MPAEHLKEEEEFDEDTLFDQAGLLTNQIKPRVDVRNVTGTMRITPMKTFALCLAFFGLGLSFAILEPTLLDLQQLAGADVQKISYTITARALGYILGSALGILLFDRYNRQFLLFLSMLSMMVLLGILPWCHNLVAYIFLLFLLGVLMQMLYAGGNVLCLDLWGKQSGPFLQAIHFSLALGIFLAPLLCNAIMMGNTGVSVPERPILLNFNSSQALALPASSLFGVHISSAGVYSRHRRQISDDIPGISLNLTDGTVDEATILPTIYVNKSSEIATMPSLTEPLLSNITLPSNSTPTTSGTIVNSTSQLENRTGGQTNATTSEPQTNATLPSTNSSDVVTVKPSHKPKPSITDAKHLKKQPDPWDRDPGAKKEAVPIPTPAPAAPTSTAQPTMGVHPTNATSGSSNETINSTNIKLSSINGSNLVLNFTSTAAPILVSVVSKNDSVSEISTLPRTPLALSTPATNQSSNPSFKLDYSKDNTGNTSGDTKLKDTQIHPIVISTSTVSTSTSTESTTPTFGPKTVHSDITVDTKSLEASDINATQESGQHLDTMSSNDSLETHLFLKPKLSTNLPATEPSPTLPQSELYPVSHSIPASTVSSSTPVAEVGDSNGEVTAVTFAKLSTDKQTAQTIQGVSPSVIISPHLSTESNVIISEHTSTVLPSYIINNNGAAVDSSEEGPNITVHHKPSTFNNQSEESPQLLNDLLNRISEMGVTKVHIVYVVMSVIVLLTSLVFLSFLCHNPRELRSKQEEGVKPGMQEGKFTSIMVGLMFVMIIFYTGAELVFSQLYLSLVWQSSAHLLRSRGSLLISVFWGLYAFSRGTSICCTNGFRPATMLLVDLVCCIVSAGTLAIFGSGVESLLWCSVAVMAIGLSSILPYSLLWLEEYIHISNKTACVVLMGGSVVNLVLSFMYGHPVTVSRSLVIYLVLTCCIFALLIFGIMWRLATWRGDKYGLNCKMDVRYQLASQVDEEEDSFELSSGNSSLYLLNNGNSQNGHTSWDSRTEPTMAYLPLKQKKTKWK